MHTLSLLLLLWRLLLLLLQLILVVVAVAAATVVGALYDYSCSHISARAAAIRIYAN